MNSPSFRQWCYEQHAKVNHYYAHYIPYRFHLEMVESTARRYPNLMDAITVYHPEKVNIIQAVASGHDIIEDTRNTWNDVYNEASRHFNMDDAREITENIYLLTNHKGRNREERANDDYYEGIRSSDIAIFIKLCDRIANVEFSKWQGTSMFDVYKKENLRFIRKVQNPFWSEVIIKETPNPVSDLIKLFL